MPHPPSFPPPAEPTRRATSNAAVTVLAVVTGVAALVGLAALAYAAAADGEANRAATPFAGAAVGMGIEAAIGAFAVALLCGIAAWRGRAPSDW